MEDINNYGALPEDWDHLDLVLGLARDLLPVVSNPNATISPKSTLKDLGKTPSLYNRAGEAVGIRDWTSKQAKDEEIESWMSNGDYGICLQTRHVRAIDIDVEDVNEAAAIERYITETLGMTLPARRRANSSKCLLVFGLSGERGKRKLEVDSGIVEILMTGQQFIAVGTHPSGARYQWDDGLPAVIPELSEELFESLWSGLIEMFGKGEGSVSVYKERTKGLSVVRQDPVRDYLLGKGLILGEVYGGDQVIIKCPWNQEHSNPDEPVGTSTVWMVAGSNGHDHGHFKCLHAHCADRTDDEFMDAIGYGAVHDEMITCMFDVVVASDSDDEMIAKLKFKRIPKTGEILPEFNNIVLALSCPAFTGVELGYDSFREEVMLTQWGVKEWISFSDKHYLDLWLVLVAKHFKELDHKKIKHAVYSVAMSNVFDSAQLWLGGLVWDGVSRVETFLNDYLGTVDSAYSRAISRYIWTGLAGRVMKPGVKADMVPVFIGNQGAGKSTAIAALSPSDEFFTDISLADKDTELSRKMRGKLVAEIPELKGLKGRDMEHIKAFITRQSEEWRPVYKEYNVKFERRLLFFGSTNEHEFLADATGNRRWLPIEVGVEAEVDVGGIKLTRDQLWAEGCELYAVGGIEYADAEALGKEAHAEYMIADSWVDMIRPYLEVHGDFPVVVSDILIKCLGFGSAGAYNRGHEMRVADILKSLGYEKIRKMISGERHVVWERV